MKIKLVYVCLFQLATSMLLAQKEVELGKSILDKTLDSALVIVQSDYVLRDTSGEDYVRKENYYTRTFSLGIVGDEALYLPSTAIFPWKSDATLKKLDLGNGKKPLLAQVLGKPFPFTTPTDIELFVIDSTSSMVLAENNPFSKSSFKVSRETGALNCWVILYSGKTTLTTNPKLTKTSFEKKVLFSENGHLDPILDSVNVPNDFLGGLVVYPSIRTGSLNLEVLALVTVNPLKNPNVLIYEPLQTKSELKKAPKKEPTVTKPPVPTTPNGANPAINKDTKTTNKTQVPEKTKGNEKPPKGH